MHKTHIVELLTGTLHLHVESGSVPIKRLLGFAARVSSKRKFLLVSKILGKHYPVTPKMMAWSYRALAKATLKLGVGSGSLWIGMAETATGLGYGVYEAACNEGVQKSLFMQTTRYNLDGIDRLEFTEAHSHATDFFLYYPVKAQYKQQFLTAHTLVLIDDEISTGKTFLRLIKAYQTVNPNLKKVSIVSLVNFAHPDDKLSLETQAGVAVEWVCFRKGLLHFDDAENTVIDQITVNVSGNGECKKHLTGWPGRLGIVDPIQLESNVVEQLVPYLGSKDERPILILGTGECNAPAYLLGRELEQQGFKVKVQSTTRSPIHPGNEIASVIEFKDNYEDNIPNFIYNMDVDDYRAIVICHETSLCQEITDRLADWQAISARFELTPSSTYAKLHLFRP